MRVARFSQLNLYQKSTTTTNIGLVVQGVQSKRVHFTLYLKESTLLGWTLCRERATHLAPSEIIFLF